MYQAVAHTAHHADFKSAIHSPALCAWMCTAGQAHERIAFNFKIELEVTTLIDNSSLRSRLKLHFIPLTTPGLRSFLP